MSKKNIAKIGLLSSVVALTASIATTQAFAEGGTTATGASGGSMVGSLLFMVLLFAVMYFILIRPQKKKDKEQKAMQSTVQIGDEIVTIGGIVGLVIRVAEDTIVIETGGDKNKMRIKTWAIQENLTVRENNEKARAASEESKQKKKKKIEDSKDEGALKD